MDCVEFLLMIPLPTLYWHTRELGIPHQDTADELDTEPGPMLRVICVSGSCSNCKSTTLEVKHVIPVGISSPRSHMA